MAEKAKPVNDSYTVLLTISLVAMIVSCVLLYYDVKRYPTITPPTISSK
ncbi:MAG TPA: hypothetical protein PKA06_06745 [Gemmatales bacterium]|mgnify:FL=1|nr:hypothetical protein [Gemmatales bacterium]